MNESQPVYLQIIELIENDIIAGVYETDALIMSTTQISKLYAVNPTTSVKAVGKLAEAGILYKKRGIGMCVAAGAREKIIKRRRTVFLQETMAAVFAEAKTLGITVAEIVQTLKEREGSNQND